ncbi:MAG: endonuclease/exonuclease/phosphatase family protein [Chitinophagaceae bacterium]
MKHFFARIYSNKIVKFILISIWLSSLFMYVLAASTPYIHPEKWVAFTFLSLLFPYLFAFLITQTIIWVLLRRNFAIASLLVILLGFQNIKNCFALNWPSSFQQEKDAEHIRVLSWNVNEFVNSEIIADSINNHRRGILNFIAKTNADVLCLQDFSSSNDSKIYLNNFTYIKDSLNYPFVFITIDDNRGMKGFMEGYGTAIFSRLPFIDTGRFAYKEMKIPEHLNYVTINKGKTTLRLYNTHLRSMSLKDVNPEIASKPLITNADTAIKTNKNIASLIRTYDLIHAGQVNFIKPIINQSSYPYLFCADLNAVPSTYVYHTLSKGLKDAFLEKGIGIGKTYHGVAPSLRIDVVLMHPSIQLKQLFTPKPSLSDHFPILVDVAVKP